MFSLLASSIIAAASLVSVAGGAAQMWVSSTAAVRDPLLAPMAARMTRIDVNIFGPSCSGGIIGSPTTYYRVQRASGGVIQDWRAHPGNGGNTNVIVPGSSGYYVAEGARRDNRGRYQVFGRTTFSVNQPDGGYRATVAVSVCMNKFN